MGGTYPKTELVVVFKNTTRKNSKIRMKVFKNKNIDNLIDSMINPRIKMVGIPKTAVYLRIGVGTIFKKMWKDKYNL